MTKLLELIINHSDTYNLKLNRAKCQLLVTNDQGKQVLFPDGTETTKHPSIKYLGATFSATFFRCRNDSPTETHGGYNHNATPGTSLDRPVYFYSMELVVFNAVVRSRIFYTLETLEFTQSQQRILDTLYFRGLRKIPKKRATFIETSYFYR